MRVVIYTINKHCLPKRVPSTLHMGNCLLFVRAVLRKRLHLARPRTSPKLAGVVWRACRAQCIYCGCSVVVERTVGAVRIWEVDHFVPWVQGGSHNLHNLVVACKSCNAAKGGAMPGAHRAGRVWASLVCLVRQADGSICGRTAQGKRVASAPPKKCQSLLCRIISAVFRFGVFVSREAEHPYVDATRCTVHHLPGSA
jgi:hypothetical protein